MTASELNDIYQRLLKAGMPECSIEYAPTAVFSGDNQAHSMQWYVPTIGRVLCEKPIYDSHAEAIIEKHAREWALGKKIDSMQISYSISPKGTTVFTVFTGRGRGSAPTMLEAILAAVEGRNNER